jgi:hypothetical protein
MNNIDLKLVDNKDIIVENDESEFFKMKKVDY